MQAVVVSFDSFPGSLTGCCGAEEAATPAFDLLAARGLVYSRCFADDLTASPADHAWWTGTRHLFRQQQPPEEPSFRLASTLAAHDVERLLLLDPRATLPVPDRAAWTRVQTAFPPADRTATVPAGTTADSPGVEGSATCLASQVDSALELLNHAADESAPAAHRQLLWLHAAGCRSFEEVEHPGDSSTRTEALQRAVQAIDHALLPLVQWATGSGAAASDDREHAEPRLLLVTSAAGTPLPALEATDETGPTAWRLLGSDVVQTPLFLLDSRNPACGRQLELVQSMDVMPTLLNWLGVPFDAAAVEGHCLTDVAGSAAEQEPATTDLLAIPPLRRAVLTGRTDRQLAGLRTGDFYLVGPVEGDTPDDLTQATAIDDTTTGPWLFAKPEDLWDVQDVSGEYRDLAEQLEDSLTVCSRGLARGENLPPLESLLPESSG